MDGRLKVGNILPFAQILVCTTEMKVDYAKLAARFPYPWWTTALKFVLTVVLYWMRFTTWNRRSFEFTNDWAEHHFETWKRLLHPLAGKPGLRYLEVGSYEGRSLLWMFDNILTHSSSRVVAIDVFAPYYGIRFLHNLARSRHAKQVKLRPGFSRDILRTMRKEKFDIIYLDGSHSMAAVMMDICLSWDLLKSGGTLIIDDYMIGHDTLPLDLRPTTTVDTFLLGFGQHIEVLHQGLQVIVRKLSDWSVGGIVFQVGNVKYDWYRKAFSINEGPQQPLTDAECELFNRYVRQLKTSYAASESLPIAPELADFLRRQGAEA